LGRVAVHDCFTEVEGPSVVILAGQHGDETASMQFASGLLRGLLSPFSGRIRVMPAVNPEAILMGWRYTGGVEDLNACYQTPIPRGGNPVLEHAQGILSLVLEAKPDLVIDLHEHHHRSPAPVWAYTVGKTPDRKIGPEGLPLLDAPGSRGSIAHALEAEGVLCLTIETSSRALYRPEQMRAYLWATVLALQTTGMLFEVSSSSWGFHPSPK
jgi:predicted deacylase